jgi:ABC-type uncharacterized transport system permease subunit
MIIIFATTASVLYFHVTLRAAQGTKNDSQYLLDSRTIAIGAIATICHAITLYHTIVTDQGLNLGVFAAASLVGWIVSLLSGLIATRKPIASLATVVLLLSFLVRILSLIA